MNDSFMSTENHEKQKSTHDSANPSATRQPLGETSANEISVPNTHGKLKRSRSSIRLSMSFDGSATIVTGDSPSPPRKRAPSTPSTALHADAHDSLSQSSFKSCLEAPDKYSGRAQDSRAWAVVADKEARSQLEEHAKQERSGNAAGAIGLMRSNSTRRNLTSSCLTASTSKRGSLSREPSMSKRTITAARKTPLLQRSQSLQNQRLLSSGSSTTPSSNKTSRLQKNHNSNGSHQHPDPSSASPRKFRKAASGLGIHLMSADADADKENWSPEHDRTMQQQHHQQRLEDSAARTVAPSAVRLQPTPRVHTPLAWNRLADSTSSTRLRMMTSPATGGGRKGLHGHRRHVDDDEDEDENEEDVAYYMRRRDDVRYQSTESGGDEEEDLAGVQGLLSLSQGNWK